MKTSNTRLSASKTNTLHQRFNIAKKIPFSMGLETTNAH